MRFPEIEGRKFQKPPQPLEDETGLLQTKEEVKKEILKVVDAAKTSGCERIGVTLFKKPAILGFGGGSSPEKKAPTEVFLTALKEVMEEYGARENPPVPLIDAPIEGSRSAMEKIAYYSINYPGLCFVNTTIYDSEAGNEDIQSLSFDVRTKEPDWVRESKT